MREKVYIIAEAGVNHNANLELAYKLIDVAVEAGVDAVKFQTAVPKLVVTKNAKMAEYQVENIGKNESQLEMTQKIHLPLSDFLLIKEYCDRKKITFLSTPFDMVSLQMLTELEMPLMKIPSGEITNLPYLRQIGKSFKKVILSTGMATLGEIENALNVLRINGCEDITVLHCNTEYPTPMEDVNLKAMLTIKEAFKVKIGYSDHTLGIEVPIAAVAMGAEVIEKHFTLDKMMEGPDHKASLSPEELKQMVISIRNIEKALCGDGKKTPSKSEIKNKEIARRSIVAAKKIEKGTLLTEDNLVIKRPNNGINPMRWDEVLGKIAIRDFEEDELIEI